MKIVLRTYGFDVSAESGNERDYIKTVLNRLVWIFNPTVTIWDMGICIEGTGKLRQDIIDKLENNV